MDKILQSQVKSLVKGSFQSFDNFLKRNNQEIKEVDFENQLNKVLDYSKVMQILQKKYIKGELDYSFVKISLRDFIYELVNLSVLLQKQQQINIEFTDSALATKDDRGYLEENLFKIAKSENERKLISQIISKNQVENLINETEQRYTASFGEFNSFEMANRILNKEFEETKEYLKYLEAIANIKIRKIDNLAFSIEAVDSLAYEAIQLSCALTRVQRFLIKQSLEKRPYKPIYVMMDEVNSSEKVNERGEFYIDDLKQKTELLNLKIKQSKKLDLICNFLTYKQDEIHGVFNGEVEDFLEIAKEVYKDHDLRMVYSDKEILNISEAPYGIPFELYGPSCNDCREKMEDPTKQIIISKGRVLKNKSKLNDKGLEF